MTFSHLWPWAFFLTGFASCMLAIGILGMVRALNASSIPHLES